MLNPKYTLRRLSYSFVARLLAMLTYNSICSACSQRVRRAVTQSARVYFRVICIFTSSRPLHHCHLSIIPSFVARLLAMLTYNSICSACSQRVRRAVTQSARVYFRVICIFTSAICVLCCSGCSSTKVPSDFYRVADAKTAPALGINNIRYVALKKTARGLGAQAGLAWRSQQINRLLERDKNKLTQIFNFSYLILNNDVLPPVLTEGRNILNLADDKNIRIADRDYQIIYPPRFITAPPNWRDYIWMNYKKPELPNSTLLPKNHREAKVWNQFIKVGWNEGINQADEIFSANTNRLIRDFSGMILYRKLLAQNMVSPPYVAEANLGVTGGGNNLRINDKVLRITSTSELIPDSKVWRPVLAPQKNANLPQITSPELSDYHNLKDKV